MTERAAAVVPADLDGVRADKVVAVLFDLSRRVARELIDSGRVIVDGGDVAAADRLVGGARVSVELPEPEPDLVPTPVGFEVVYEDGHVLIVNKPAGVVVHPGAGTAMPTLVAGLVHRYPDLGALAHRRYGLVHRLDRDTSGLLVVGRTATAFDRLQAALKARTIVRTYLEDQTLQAELAGYADYTRRTRYRLIPLIW